MWKAVRSSFLAAALVGVAAACGGEPADSAEALDTETGNLEAAAPDGSCPAPKLAVCHIPPGNPDNAHTICIGERALRAHLAHGDTEGACDTSDVPTEPEGGEGSAPDAGTSPPEPGEDVVVVPPAEELG